MKILITGATGFIGHQLVSTLSHEHKLTILTRSPSTAHHQLGAEHQYLASLSSLSDFNEFDAIINLAGEPIANKRWTDKQKLEICNSRWDITSSLTDVINANQKPANVFISSSAIGIYGSHGAEPIDESYTFNASTGNNGFTFQVCRKWEALATKAESEQTRVCILRTGLVLGLSGGALSKMIVPFRLALGGPIGHGQQGMSWIHQDDHIGLIQFLLASPNCSGVFNATAPHPVSNYQYSKLLGKALSRPALMPMPATLLKLVLGEMSELLTQGQYVIPTRTLDAGYQYKYPELYKALLALLK